MALVRTDYGLIYNTDGSLCATLLPEGGVAVTEGTTNLIPSDRLKFEGWLTYQGASVTIEQGHSIPGITSDGATRIQISGGTHAVKYFYNVGPGDAGTSASYRVWVRNIGDKPVQVYGNVIGGWNIVYPGETKLCTGSTDAVNGTTHRQIQFWALDVDDSLDFIVYQPQIEEKPYATSFVDGTRPAGALSYNLPISINGDWTIAKWLELEPYFMDKSYSGDKPIEKFRLPLLELGKTYYTEGHGTLGIYGAWTDSQPGKTICIMVNKDQVVTYSSSPDTITLTEAEYNNKILAVLTKSGSMLTAYIYTVQNKYVLTCDITSLGDISQIAPQLNYHTVTTGDRMYCKRHLNTLVCLYAVSPETVATWHSLDAPFFDPREQIDAGARPIYAPGVIIDNTGAWGIANGVKQAGFGTDGKQIAGEGRWVADATGVKLFNKAYTDPTAVMTYWQKIDGTQEFYSEDTGEKTFAITPKGELIAADGYVMIDATGKVNARIIKHGFIESAMGENIPLGNYVVPEGKKLVSYVIPLDLRLPGSNKNKTLKYIYGINVGATCTYHWSKGYLMSAILPPGTYNNLMVVVDCMSSALYGYTDGTEEEVTRVYPCYYEIREVFD